jgi:hypothetical protein
MTGKTIFANRRLLLTGAVAAGAVGLLPRYLASADAQSQPGGGSYKPTEAMAGGANNYEPNAPLVENLGTGFVVSGLVARPAMASRCAMFVFRYGPPPSEAANAFQAIGAAS